MSSENILQTVTADQIMCQNVMTVPEDWPVDQLARFLTDKSISGAPVINDSGQLTGVVSFSDIVRHAGSDMVDHSRRDDDFYNSMLNASMSPEDQRSFHESVDDTVMVRDIMTPMIFEVAPDTPLFQVAEAMAKGRIHRVMVTEKRELKGIISALDILKVLTL
ncbi:CBS domain-containing protein [Endozoicomonadaceae bacterium StTr2]